MTVCFIYFYFKRTCLTFFCLFVLCIFLLERSCRANKAALFFKFFHTLTCCSKTNFFHLNHFDSLSFQITIKKSFYKHLFHFVMCWKVKDVMTNDFKSINLTKYECSDKLNHLSISAQCWKVFLKLSSVERLWTINILPVAVEVAKVGPQTLFI